MARTKKGGSKSRTKKKAKPGRSARVAKRSKPKAAARKKSARGASTAAKRGPAREPAPPPILDEVIEQSQLDVSAILRVKDAVARSRRDVDEDELKQFSDPSLVVEAQSKTPRPDEDDDLGEDDGPSFFGTPIKKKGED